MPPTLAACIFVGFILWLLRRYRKDAGATSPGLWVPFIWVVIGASRPVGYWFVQGSALPDTVDVTQGSFIDRNTYLFLIIAGVFVLCRRRIDWNSLLVRGRWLWIFYAYLLLSTLWSDHTFISFKRWFKDSGDLVMIAIILSETDPVEAIRWIFVRCTYVLIPLSVLFIKYYPTIGRYENRWTYTQGACGITLSKNELGLLAMVSGLFLLWQLKDVYRSRGARLSLRFLWPDLLVLGMCLWILWIAESATSLTGFIIGAAVFFGLRLQAVRRNFRNLGWVLAGVAVLLLFFTVSPGFRGIVAGALGRDVTLTTRTEIWQRALELNTNPLIGAGFFSVWLTRQAAPMVEDWHLSHAHNGYLETYLNSGCIGVCLLLAVLISAGKNARSQLFGGGRVGYLFFAIFLAGLFYNYTEVTFNRGNVLGMLLWLISAYGPAVIPEQGRPVIVGGAESTKKSFANVEALAGDPPSLAKY